MQAGCLRYELVMLPGKIKCAHLLNWYFQQVSFNLGTTMKKIIHLSDLHYGWKKRANKALKNIVASICFEKEPAFNYVVVITGDLVNNANKSALYPAVQQQLEILKQKGFEVLVIPGNHDYGNGLSGKKKFVQQFKATFFKNEDIQYPKVDISYDPASPADPADAIAFIGLDTMAEELGFLDHLWAEGELGEQQLERFDAVLANAEIKQCGKRVLYMHHHPFDPYLGHQLKDSKKLEQVIAAHFQKGTTIDALLYGHNHRGKSHHGKWNIPRCYDGSSSTGKKKSKSDPTLQRVIDLCRDPRWDYSGEFHL